jgi:hypothetical protein
MVNTEGFNEYTAPDGVPCPYCGKSMRVLHRPPEHTVQMCNAHGVFSVDEDTKDVWELDGFEKDMTPIRRRWYLIENHIPLTVTKYRAMVKLANYRRLEEK